MAYTRAQLIALVEGYAASYGIDPAIAVAQIERESGWRADVVYGPFVGAAGERGIAQFIPGTWAQWGSGNPYNPDDSMRAWGEFMTYLRAKYRGDYWKTLAAYNGGEGNVDRGTISDRARRYATEILAQAGQRPSSNDATSGDVPPWADYCDPDGFCYAQSWEGPQPESKQFPWLEIGIGAVLLVVGFVALKD